MGNKRHLDEITRKGLFSFFLKVFAAFLAFSVNVVVSRILGAEQAGAYFLSLTIITILAVFCRLGFDRVVVRCVTKVNADGDNNLLRRMYQKYVTYTVATAAVVAITLFTVAPIIGRYFKSATLADARGASTTARSWSCART